MARGNVHGHRRLWERAHQVLLPGRLHRRVRCVVCLSHARALPSVFCRGVDYCFICKLQATKMQLKKRNSLLVLYGTAPAILTSMALSFQTSASLRHIRMPLSYPQHKKFHYYDPPSDSRDLTSVDAKTNAAEADKRIKDAMGNVLTLPTGAARARTHTRRERERER